MNIGIESSDAQDRVAKLPRARTFEDLLAWQKARHLTKKMYEVTRSPTFRLAGQSQRAAVSIMANIAEGFDRRGAGEFVHFLSYSKGSCSELRSHLFVALDSGHIGDEEFSELKFFADEVSRLIQSLIASLQRSQAKQEK